MFKISKSQVRLGNMLLDLIQGHINVILLFLFLHLGKFALPSFTL